MDKELILWALCEQHEREEERGCDKCAKELDDVISNMDDVIITMDMDTSRLIAMRLEGLINMADGLEASQIAEVVNKIHEQLDH